MKLRLAQMAALLVVCIFLFLPVSTANVREWSYENYLYSLETLSHDDAVTAGRSGSITMEVGANTDVVLHLEFKGQFSWGHWVFHSKDIPIPAGSSTVSDEVNAPYKTLIEPASEFYYYVYATLPGDEWNPSAWGLTQPVTVLPPVDVTYNELVSCMSHLKWLVDTSTLSDGIKQSLFTKLEAAGLKIENSYATGNLDKLPGAVGSLEGFINEIESDNEAASYTDSETWKEQAGFIINRIEAAVI